ncbi:MAG: DUF2541 family protein [Verrucomicrobia bacterium]|nr:DUF2541 family protein [Cytophagales bacterium]
MKNTLKIVFFIMIVAFGQQVFAQEGTWEKVGQKKVNYRAERDVMVVTAAKGRYTKVRLKVLGGAVNFRDMKIFYGNGDIQDVSLRNTIPAGGESRIIDLVGRERTIQKIEFIYDTKNNANRKATVVVFAKE